MTYEQYWEQDCTLVIPYRQADRLRQERINSECWLQGAYIYDALALVSPLFRPAVKGGTKAKPYHKEPYKPKQAEKQVPLTAEEERKKVIESRQFFDEVVRQWNKRFDEKAKEGVVDGNGDVGVPSH